MFIKPTKPWKNLEAARLSMGFSKDRDPNDFPCLACGGRGGHHNEDDRDPYEGYKMATLHRCRACDGTRVGSKAVFMEHYRKQMTQYKKEMAEYKWKIQRLKELKAELSEEDWRILEVGIR